MPAKRYFVNLTQKEKEELQTLISSGKSKARVQTRARILLLCDEHPKWSDKKIAEVLLCSVPTVERIRKRCVEESFENTLYDKKRNRVYERKLDAVGEAHLITLACSNPPEGRSSWTMQLLADKLVELGIVDSISDETVRRTLKKMKLNLGLRKVG
jgi:DNA-binding MarR family transcriptional regulator